LEYQHFSFEEYIQESWEDAVAKNLLIDVEERFKVGAINHARASILSLVTQTRIKKSADWIKNNLMRKR
jgi:hypothetical protein